MMKTELFLDFLLISCIKLKFVKILAAPTWGNRQRRFEHGSIVRWASPALSMALLYTILVKKCTGFLINDSPLE